MGSYPAARRSAQLEAQIYAERERLYEWGVSREDLNLIMERLQAKYGSKNKLAEAVYGRKNAASAVKQVMEGSTRYTDAVVERILRVAAINGIPKNEHSAVSPANDDVTADLPTTSTADETEMKQPDASLQQTHAPEADRPGSTDAVQSDTTQPEAHQMDTSQPVDSDAGSEDVVIGDEDRLVVEVKSAEQTPVGEQSTTVEHGWLSGVVERRTSIMAEVTEHETVIESMREEQARLLENITRHTALKNAANTAIREIDTALSILQNI